MDTQIVKIVDHEDNLVDFGLKYGPVIVEPAGFPPDDKIGYVLLVHTRHKSFEIRATPKGQKLQIIEETGPNHSEMTHEIEGQIPGVHDG